jgi:hypothetical protein
MYNRMIISGNDNSITDNGEYLLVKGIYFGLSFIVLGISIQIYIL